jgi:hypothetical protein
MTGKLFPSGRLMNTILMQPSFNSEPIPIQVSVFDAANPFCLVDSSTLPGLLHREEWSSPETLTLLRRSEEKRQF